MGMNEIVIKCNIWSYISAGSSFEDPVTKIGTYRFRWQEHIIYLRSSSVCAYRTARWLKLIAALSIYSINIYFHLFTRYGMWSRNKTDRHIHNARLLSFVFPLFSLSFLFHILRKLHFCNKFVAYYKGWAGLLGLFFSSSPHYSASDFPFVLVQFFLQLSSVLQDLYR